MNQFVVWTESSGRKSVQILKTAVLLASEQYSVLCLDPTLITYTQILCHLQIASPNFVFPQKNL